jgi:Holliday junction resolvase
MINVKRKGAKGELDWRDKVREYGFDCARGRQYHGGQDSPDVVSEDLDRYHFEVKFSQNTSFYKWFRQAAADAGPKIPVVAHRANHGDWHVFIAADHFLELLKQIK